MATKKIYRIGERNYNKDGLLMEIIKYNNNKDIVVKFLATGEEVRSRYDLFQKGEVKATQPLVPKSHIVIPVITGMVVIIGVISLLVLGIKALL